jgi:hypothetical protein
MTAARRDLAEQIADWNREWSPADYARDADDVRADYAAMVGDQMYAAAWEASRDAIDDRPHCRELTCDRLTGDRDYAHQDLERLLSRFVAKTVRDDISGCLIWTGTRNKDGYGGFNVSRWTKRKAHRVSYELFVGPIPAGAELDHLCKTRSCVEPTHLEPVTHAENNARSSSLTALNAKKTECIRGHPFDEANTRITPQGFRRCRACDRDLHRRQQAAQPDPWGIGPVHHPTRFDLPMPAEPPF